MNKLALVAVTFVACSSMLAPSSKVQAEHPLSLTDPDHFAKQAYSKQKGSNYSQKSKSRTMRSKRSRKTLKTYVAYRVAHSAVSTSCFKGRLRSILSKVRAKYGKQPIVSSGYRSPRHNRRVGGARSSYHMKCQAADIKVPGVNKYSLARYLKTVSGVGGVGTYGCNSSVHVDVGPRRTWHWRCRRRG